jgi:hypothetical protein
MVIGRIRNRKLPRHSRNSFWGGGAAGKRSLVTVNEGPVSGIGERKAVGSNEHNPIARPAQLYLKTIEKRSIDEGHNLLRFYSELLISNNKTHAAYTLFDSDASHGFVNERFV